MGRITFHIYFSSKHYKLFNILIQRTIEYMSPEVMDLQRVSTAADMWGVGCITFQLLSGGISPFFAHNRFRTMAKVLDCDYSLEQAELNKTSPEAKDFISMLLITVSDIHTLARSSFIYCNTIDYFMYFTLTTSTSYVTRT